MDRAGTGNAVFVQAYQRLRAQEQRCCSDAELARLPFVPRTHPLHGEWAVRRRSARRLCRYLQRMRRPLRVLEVGCGNGWLANRLAGIPQCTVTGMDINEAELQQAARVFIRDNLRFAAGSLPEQAQRFDIILFAAALQYFSPAEDVLRRCLQRLLPGGEVHILDTKFYAPHEQPLARARSRDYFQKMGAPELQPFYHHLGWSELAAFSPVVLYRPGGPFRRHPFPWIKITKP